MCPKCGSENVTVEMDESMDGEYQSCECNCFGEDCNCEEVWVYDDAIFTNVCLDCNHEWEE